jgi:hypothetical protein
MAVRLFGEPEAARSGLAVRLPVEPEKARSGQAVRPVSPRLLTPFSLFNLVQFPNLECATETGQTMEYKTLTGKDIQGVIEDDVSLS